MKSTLLRHSAAVVLAAAIVSPAYALQTPAGTDTPAGTKINPQPTVQEDLVYLKDIVALQTLRLDEAEELITRQNALIEAQARQIQALTTNVAAIGQAQSVALATAGSVGSYTVKSGDTLSAIARRNNTTIAELAKANNLRSPYRLSVGANLKVPGAAPVMVAAAPPPAPQQTAAAPQPKVQEKISQAPAQNAAQPAPTRTASAASSPEDQARVNRQSQAARDAANRDNNRREDDEGLPTEVGVRDENENERPYLAIFSDSGGILTPKGSFFIEPSVDYTVTSDNRFFFQGIEIVDAVLIGAIEATDTDRSAITEGVSFRYGLTNRLEVDGRIAYVSRKDRVAGVAIDDSTSSVRNLGGYGFSDAEMGLHYQINNGGKWPYAVANLRVKAPTGTGPFDVDRNIDNGIETELATGSGFWTIEPSMTFILSSDPASLYANIGYQKNMSVSPNEVLVDTESLVTDIPGNENLVASETVPTRTTLLDFDPGDAIRIGVGLSLNEKLSLNFGYDQSYFLNSRNNFETITRQQQFQVAQNTTENPDYVDGGPPVPALEDDQPIPLQFNDQPVFGPPQINLISSVSPSTTVGSFLFGGSYAVNNRLRINLNGAIGATAEAPDARISLRAQYRLFD